MRWRTIGVVKELWIRAKGCPPVGVESAEVIVGRGLRDDCHADPLSPRQILLASAQVYQRLGMSSNALSENVLIDADLAEVQADNVLRIGSAAMLWLTFACEPCAKLNGHGPRLMQRIGAQRGMLARALASGVIAVGDEVRSGGRALPRWSPLWCQRVEAVVRAVPDGCVVEYSTLARLSGVPLSYCRVVPRVLTDLPKSLGRRAVPAGGAPSMSRWLGAGMFATGDPFVKSMDVKVSNTSSHPTAQL